MSRCSYFHTLWMFDIEATLLLHCFKCLKCNTHRSGGLVVSLDVAHPSTVSFVVFDVSSGRPPPRVGRGPFKLGFSSSEWDLLLVILVLVLPSPVLVILSFFL